MSYTLLFVLPLLNISVLFGSKIENVQERLAKLGSVRTQYDESLGATSPMKSNAVGIKTLLAIADSRISFVSKARLSLRPNLSVLKFEETYHDINVWDSVITLRENAKGDIDEPYSLTSGQFIDELNNDVSEEDVKYSATCVEQNIDLLFALKRHLNDHDLFINYYDIKPLVYTIRKNTTKTPKSVIACEFSYTGGRVNDGLKRICGIVNAKTRLVLDWWNCLKEVTSDSQPAPYYNAPTSQPNIVMNEISSSHDGRSPAAFYKPIPTISRGPGGNFKTRKYQYGDNMPYLNASFIGGRCALQNKYVTVIDNHGIATHNFNKVHKFACCEGSVEDEVNGGFSSLNDALYFGTLTYKMFIDWYHVPPIRNQLIIRAHYGNEYANAIFDGRSVAFGDGTRDNHPFTSCDIVAHEITHGFTEEHSNLRYKDESGAIDEAFCDMAGEAAEYYHKKKVDWMFGADVTKRKHAIRFLFDPPADGVSIKNATLYHRGVKIHRASGIFNRAFYILSHEPGYNVKKAFDVFVRANQLYWRRTTNFANAVCGVVRAGYDLNYDTANIIDSFQKVGLACNEDLRGVGKFHPWLKEGGCRKGWLRYIRIRTVRWIGRGGYRMYMHRIPKCARDLRFEIITPDPYGDPDLFVKPHVIPTELLYFRKAVTRNSNSESLQIKNPRKGLWFIMVRARHAIRTASLTISYFPN